MHGSLYFIVTAILILSNKNYHKKKSRWQLVTLVPSLRDKDKGDRVNVIMLVFGTVLRNLEIRVHKNTHTRTTEIKRKGAVLSFWVQSSAKIWTYKNPAKIYVLFSYTLIQT